MVHLLPVGKLVNRHILHNLFRRQSQQTVEVQIPFRRAAAPAAALAADADPAVGNTHVGSVTLQHRRKLLPCLLLQLFQGRFIQRRKGALRLVPEHLGPVDFDPPGLFRYKGLDFPVRHPKGRPDLQIPPRGNAQRKGFPS